MAELFEDIVVRSLRDLNGNLLTLPNASSPLLVDYTHPGPASALLDFPGLDLLACKGLRLDYFSQSTTTFDFGVILNNDATPGNYFNSGVSITQAGVETGIGGAGANTYLMHFSPTANNPCSGTVYIPIFKVGGIVTMHYMNRQATPTFQVNHGTMIYNIATANVIRLGLSAGANARFEAGDRVIILKNA